MTRTRSSWTRRFLAGAALLALPVWPAVSEAIEWKEIVAAPGFSPTARAYTSACYDSQRHRLVFFGGESAGGKLNDVWAFNLGPRTWIELTPSSGPMPVERVTPNNIYDPVGDRMIMWSGLSGGFNNDVWEFDFDTGTWSEFSPSPPLPEARYGVASIYDPVDGDLVMFAGFTTLGRFHDIRRFDPVAVTWTDVSPAVAFPQERCLHTASYNSFDHEYILYGGQRMGALGDIWSFDLATHQWTDLTPVASPPGRWFASQVYDANNHRALVFGGDRGAGLGKTNEVWAFDLDSEAWEQLFPAGTAPMARDGSAAIYIQSEDRMVIFGGKDTGYYNDLWSLEEITGAASVDGSPLGSGPGALALTLNPNPARSETTVSFTVPGDGRVSIEVFDTRGRHVRALLDEARAAGPQTVNWNGRDDGGERVPAGVYFVKLRASGAEATIGIAMVR